MKISKRKRIELFLGVVYMFVATFFILKFNLGYTETAFIYMGIPSIYFSIVNPSIIKKTFLYSLFAVVPLHFVIDYMATVGGSWYEPPALTGLLVLGVFPLDAFFWAFLYSYLILSFYEYFFDRDRKKDVFSKKIKYLFYIILAILLLFSVIYLFNKELLVTSHFFIFFIVIAFVLPILTILYKYPALFPKIAFQSIYFSFLSVIFELTALKLIQWQYLGNYLGWVEIFGIGFPLEEALFILFAVPAHLCLYEFFADDRK